MVALLNGAISSAKHKLSYNVCEQKENNEIEKQGEKKAVVLVLFIEGICHPTLVKELNAINQ